jgi:ATP/maltotriose-dependent transcriptional regulator MalT
MRLTMRSPPAATGPRPAAVLPAGQPDRSLSDLPDLLSGLCANQDPRASDVLHTAHRLLQELAAKIDDEDLRHSFLHNVSSCRRIKGEFARLEAAAFSDKENLTTPSASSPDLIESLTPQEIQVLRLLADGLTNRQIAERLVITVGTIKFHTHSIYGKLGVEIAHWQWLMPLP